MAVACEAHDIDEIFGNLLDNALMHARARVRCTVRAEGADVRFEIADDGEGLTAEEAVLALQPGMRLDEQQPGSGFGLTIARELVELYGGELRPGAESPGLLVVATLPGSRSPPGDGIGPHGVRAGDRDPS